MNLVAHNAEGATVHLDQRELLLVMALIHEGREALGYNNDTGSALEQFFCASNVLVEQARRRHYDKVLRRQKRSINATPHSNYQKGVSNG